MTPDWRVFVAGNDITQSLARALPSIQVVDQSGTEADRMKIVAADHEHVIQWPDLGTEVYIAMGYKDLYLVDMGTYVIDEVEMRQPPRSITVKGNSADLRQKRVKQRRQGAYHNTTVERLVDALATEAGYTSCVDPDLANYKITHWDRSNESVMSVVTRLARRYDAVATVKRGNLTFIRRGTGHTCKGVPREAITIYETSVTDWSSVVNDRHKYKAATARYRDTAAAEDKWTGYGDLQDYDATYRLRQTYPDQQSAEAAAEAKYRALVQSCASFSFTCPGNPYIHAQTPLDAHGFDRHVDGRWIVDQVDHTIDNSGFISRVSAKPPAP